MMVDMSLLVMLPVLMAEILTGQEFHEWLGTAMAVANPPSSLKHKLAETYRERELYAPAQPHYHY